MVSAQKKSLKKQKKKYNYYTKFNISVCFSPHNLLCVLGGLGLSPQQAERQSGYHFALLANTFR